MSEADDAYASQFNLDELDLSRLIANLAEAEMARRQYEASAYAALENGVDTEVGYWRKQSEDETNRIALLRRLIKDKKEALADDA
jgi:hypothetical protein